VGILMLQNRTDGHIASGKNAGFLLILLLFVSLLSGCAATGKVNDPFEPVNRHIYSFNKTADTYIVKPIAKGYDAVLPGPVKTGVTNFFNNLDDLPIAANGLLQGRPQDTASDLARVVLNTTMGVFGLFDVASRLGVVKHEADFGQTLGKWGVKSSPYLIIPILGASTIRDGIGRSVDWYLSPWPWINPEALRYGLYAFDGISIRSEYLQHEDLFDVAAFDEYIAVRNAYLQRRDALINGDKHKANFKDDSGFDDPGFD